MKRMIVTVTMLALALALAVPVVAQTVENLGADPINNATGQYEPALEPSRDLVVERIFQDESSPLYPESPQVLLASSAAALSSAIGREVLDSGEGTYLAAFWGTKGTGGYSLAIESVRLEGDLATIELTLQEPGPYDAVPQAITSTYAVAVVREPGLIDKNFSFVDQTGQELGWPVYQVES